MPAGQTIIEFYGDNSLGVKNSVKLTLRDAISKANGGGWKVDQVCPMGYQGNGNNGFEISHGILLCTKIE